MNPYETHRDLLFSVAYRILGSAAEAEDAVQDTWLKWSAADRSGVADPRAYLVRVVTNGALDRLRAARARRETYVGPWLPEPILTVSAADDVEAAESVSVALMVLLESLSPLERAVFVLREAFGFSHAEIAAAVDRSEEAVRQAGHRAREHVRARRPRVPDPGSGSSGAGSSRSGSSGAGSSPAGFSPAGSSRAGLSRARQEAVTARFLAAASGGDINALMEILAPT